MFEFESDGEQRQVITLSPGAIDIKGMTFIGANLFFADDDTNKIYKGSIPHGISITTDPLALAANGTTTLFVLVDGTPRDKIILVDPATGATTSSYDVPDDDGRALTYLGGSLYYASNLGSNYRIHQLNPSTGAVLSTMNPQYPWGDIFDNLLGLGNDESDLILSTARDDFWNQCLEMIASTNGQNQGQLCAGNESLGQAEGVAVAPDGFILIAENDIIVQLGPEGNESARWSGLAGTTDIRGLAFVGRTLYIADDDTDKVYKTTVPSGVQVTTDPLALAYGTANNTTTLFVLVDAVPRDVVLLVDPGDGSLAATYDAPDDEGEGLTYLGGSLYYASNKDNDRRIYRLDPDTGAQLSNFSPQDQWGNNFDDRLLGLGNDGSDLILSHADPWDPCVEVIDSATGSNQGRLCAEWQVGLTQANGVAVASDGFILLAKDDMIVQLSSEGMETARWQSLVSATDIQGLALVGSALYIADDDSNAVLKATVPSGIQVTTDPLGLAYGTANSTTTLFILVDGTPLDKVLLVDPLDGTLDGSYDAPDNDGAGLTYLDGSLFYASNDDGNRRIYELGPDSGAQLGSFFPQDQWGNQIWSSLTALANDGSDLLIAVQDPFDRCLSRVASPNGASEGQFCPPYDDALTSPTGLAVTAEGDVIEAKDGTLVHATADETYTVTYNTSLGDIQGLTFVGSNLYAADDDDDTIYKTAVPSGIDITTSPRALAYGMANGTTTMFILVDATPRNMVLLVDSDTGALVDSYDAPDRRGQGVTYLGSSLYYAGQDQDGRAKIYELDPDTGAVLSTIFPKFNWGGEIWDEPRSLGNNGSDLLASFGNDNCIQRIDPFSGDNQGSMCPDFFGQGLDGPRGLSVASDGTIFTARDMDIVQMVSMDPELEVVGRWSTAAAADIEGLVIVGDVLYIADDGADSVYKASQPTGITNEPLGLAYDGAHLYILMEGALTDHIVVVDPADGAVIRDFEAPDRDSFSITYLDPSLYVAVSRPDEGFGISHVIERISPVDGSVEDTLPLPPDFWGEEVGGLTNNGSSLIATQNRGAFALSIDPNSGGIDERIEFYNGFFDGFGGLAFHEDSDDLFAVDGGVVYRFDEDGRLLDDRETSLSRVEGAVISGQVIYLAEGSSSTIHAAAIPAPPTVITTSPKGMATDGVNLYVVVDGSPKDRILVLDAGGSLIDSYEAPGDDTDALAWHDAGLYAVTNEFHPFYGDLPPRIHSLDAATGEVLFEFEIQSPWGGPVWERIAGLAGDGGFLYAGLRDEQGWFRIDPAFPDSPATRIDTFVPTKFRFMESTLSLEIAVAAPLEPRLLAGGYADGVAVLSEFDKDTGDMLDQFEIGGVDIMGMAYIGSTLYLADASSDAVLVTTLPENIPEITTVGGYTAALAVVIGEDTVESDPAAQLSTVRNTDVLAQITTPLDNFATTTEVIPIRGRVSDPSIGAVQVGVVLPFTSLLDDPVTQAQSPELWQAEGLWRVDCSFVWNPPIYSSEPCAWRYGELNQPSYGQGVVSQGSLTTIDAIDVGPGTRLSFRTWYATESVPESDLKLVEVAHVTTVDGNDVIGDYQALGQIVGFGFLGTPIPTEGGEPLFEPHADFEHWKVEQAPMNFDSGEPLPRFETIEKSLHSFVGERIMLRFRFDMVNNFANGDLGWFVDDISVEGAGFKGQQTPVSPLDPPVTEGGTTWYGTFETTFSLAEGSNQVVARAQQPYPPKPHGPNLVGADFVFGFLDLTGPSVTLGGIGDIVASPSQTLGGTVVDINFTSMVITHTYVAGNVTTSKIAYAITNLPIDRTFSLPVSLLKGTNTFTATAIDGSLNQSVVTFVVELDTVAPTLTPLSASYPVGATSARAGDLVVFQADVADLLGVRRVYMTLPGDEVSDMVLSAEVPEAVLDQWGVTGEWLLPLEIPAATPPGAFELAITAVDNAGNEVSDIVVASVVPTLEGFTFNLLPGQNLISLPLQPTTTTIEGLLGNELLSAIDTIMYYDASLTGFPQEDRWLMYSPDAPSQFQTLHELQTGRGYWISMKDEAFSFSAPLAPGLPPTPRPIVFSYPGVFLLPGAVPPTYPVTPGWNLIGFHSEHPLSVTTALQSLESPQRVWASLFQYDNVILFDLDEDPVIILGGFSRVLAEDMMEPRRGFWIFMVDSGVIVP